MKDFSLDHPTKCTVLHAPSMRESCGHIRQRQYGEPEYRCDRRPGHSGQHHCCGSGWKREWGLVVPGLTDVVPEVPEVAA